MNVGLIALAFIAVIVLIMYDIVCYGKSHEAYLESHFFPNWLTSRYGKLARWPLMAIYVWHMYGKKW